MCALEWAGIYISLQKVLGILGSAAAAHVAAPKTLIHKD